MLGRCLFAKKSHVQFRWESIVCEFAILTLVTLLLMAPGQLWAQGKGATVPEVEIPRHFLGYSDSERVASALKEVIEVLGKSKFNFSENDLTNECRSPEIAAKFRGMLLIHAAYNMFVNKIELGWITTKSVLKPGGSYYLQPNGGEPPRAITDSMRLGVLFLAWSPEKISGLLDLVPFVGQLPPQVKGDLRAFLTEIRDSNSRYKKLKERAPDQIRLINHRSTEEYVRDREQIVSRYPNDVVGKKIVPSDIAMKWPEPIQDVSEAFRVAFESIRDPGESALNSCLDEFQSADKEKHPEAIFSDDKRLIYSPTVLFPTSYFFGFWHRRTSEGTVKVVDFFLSRVIDVLN